MPGSHAGMAGFNSLLYFQFQFPANADPRRQQVSAQALVSLPAQVPTCACWKLEVKQHVPQTAARQFSKSTR